jgi:arginine-tRNA-protein transferase
MEFRMKPHTAPPTVPVYATGEHPCAYLPDRQARTLFVDPRQTLDSSLYSTLAEQGFRRSGDFIYRPGCHGCSACKSLRIPVRDFRLGRRHRRCLASNADVRVQAVSPTYRSEHFDLYQRYIASRHVGSQMSDPTPQQYLEFLATSWGKSRFYEFRENDRLLAVSVIDELNSGLSAIYTFYEPTLAQRSLGTLSIIWLIRETERLGLDYLYLGYWIAESPKMRYKADFKPHEIFDGNAWQRVTDG